jgi:hypothetical protein
MKPEEFYEKQDSEINDCNKEDVNKTKEIDQSSLNLFIDILSNYVIKILEENGTV